ncbi:oligosaccharide flippase family protein [Niallia oryzisoli]|uniref:oligosaccharide flippase family protein n=1 Tax=Niallia oryzisoli TaxID=1737571 RepID=UPI0037358BEF
MEKLKRNSILKNIIHLFFSTSLASALNAIVLIVLATYLQSYYYGMFSVILAFAMIMGYFTDAGLSSIVLREGSKKETNLSILVSSYIKMRMGLLFATFVIGFAVIHVSNQNHQEMIEAAYIFILPMVTGVALQSIGTTYFQLTERMQYYGLIKVTSSVFLVAGICIGFLFNLSPFSIYLLYGSSYLAAGVFALYLVHKNSKIRLNSKFHKGILQNFVSFTLSGLLFVLLPQLGPIVLEKAISLNEVGLFAVAYRIPQALQQIPMIIAGAFSPVLFRAFHDHRLSDHLRYSLSMIKMMALAGMMMTIPIYYMADWVIEILFGEKWAAAALPMKILSVILILQAVNIALADGLTTRGLQNYRTLVQAISVLSGMLLYLFFSQSYGVTGAALAGVLIEAIALLGFWLFNPNRWIIANKAIIPYLSYFSICLFSIDRLLGTLSLLAASVHLLLLGLILLVDREVRQKMMNYIKRVTGGKMRNQGVSRGMK